MSKQCGTEDGGDGAAAVVGEVSAKWKRLSVSPRPTHRPPPPPPPRQVHFEEDSEEEEESESSGDSEVDEEETQRRTRATLGVSSDDLLALFSSINQEDGDQVEMVDQLTPLPPVTPPVDVTPAPSACAAAIASTVATAGGKWPVSRRGAFRGW